MIEKVDLDFETIFKKDRLTIIAHLMAKYKNLNLVEDQYQEALIQAMQHWQENGLPRSPKAWLIKVTSNKILDQLRRLQNFNQKQDALIFHTENIYEENQSHIYNDSDDENTTSTSGKNVQHQEDVETLKLIFLCCHPALKQDAQIALSLNVIGGLRVDEIAKAFLLPKSTMAKRLTRAKQKIKLSNIPFKMPNEDQIKSRLNQILNIIYLIHNEAYQSTHKAQISDETLCKKALSLIEIMNQLLPKNPHIMGLNALILLQMARFEARMGAGGTVIILEYQNRNIWNQTHIENGKALILKALTFGDLCKYQILAAVNAIHSEAITYENTDFLQIKLLYQKLYEIEPTPTIKLNLFAAQFCLCDQQEDFASLLEQTNGLNSKLMNYVPFHLLKAEIYKKLNHKKMANQHMQLAIQNSENQVEIDYFKSQLLDL